jgi:hypothetical protein
MFDEPFGQRLGQCSDGELLLVVEDRAHTAQNVPDSRSGIPVDGMVGALVVDRLALAAAFAAAAKSATVGRTIRPFGSLILPRPARMSSAVASLPSPDAISAASISVTAAS